jgi:hypothetical protein
VASGVDVVARREERARHRKAWATFVRTSRTWVDDRLAALPFHWRRRALAEYLRRGGAVPSSDGNPIANAWLRDTAEMAGGRVSLAAGDHEIQEAAKRAALEGLDFCRVAADQSLRGVEDRLREHCAKYGIEGPNCGGKPAIARMLCNRWWLRRLRAATARRCESAAVGAQLICRGVWPYASQDGCDRRSGQRNRNAQAVARAELIDRETGEIIDLAEVVRGSVANPEVRRSELMVRIRGCEEFATARNMVAEFWTLTTPSRFHAQRMAGSVSEANPNYDGSRPNDGQRYLCKVWARWRAACHRRGLRTFGMRVAEPHHDATPHWHILIFGERREVRHARRLLKVYALRDSPGEAGALRHRFTATAIDAAKGDAAGYVAKYVAKNIDGFGVGLDGETGRPADKIVKRCDTWASAWRIRQFQFFGTPGVTIWRELRKVREVVSDTAVEDARAAADAGDWRAYMETMLVRPVSMLTRPAGRLTAYGEEAPDIPIAFVSATGCISMNRRTFEIRWGCRGVPRTRVNNCTGPSHQVRQPVVDKIKARAAAYGVAVGDFLGDSRKWHSLHPGASPP